jgi:uncharacterized SAM-binding protein YcdF (DUF218 family)
VTAAHPPAWLVVGLLLGALLAALLAASRRRRFSATVRSALGGGAVALAIAAAALVSGSDELHKVVGECLMPAGLVWVGLGVLAFALWRRAQRGMALAATGLWVLLTAAGNPLLGGWLLGVLGRPYAHVDPLASGHFDAVVVLGGGVAPTADGQPSLTGDADRVVLAVRMFRAGLTDALVSTGAVRRLSGGRTVSDSEATLAFWAGLGVPAERMFKINGTRTTSDEIPAFRNLARERGWRRVGIITSAWHLPRAMRLARRAGLDAAPLPASGPERLEISWRNLLPQESGFRQVQFACWELLGMLAGR